MIKTETQRPQFLDEATSEWFIMIRIWIWNDMDMVCCGLFGLEISP